MYGLWNIFGYIVRYDSNPKPKAKQDIHVFSYIPYAHSVKVMFSGIFSVLIFGYSPGRSHVELSIGAACLFVTLL